MAIQIIEERAKRPSFSQKLKGAVGTAIGEGLNFMKGRQEEEAFKKLMGDEAGDYSGLSPEFKKLAYQAKVQQEMELGKRAKQLIQDRAKEQEKIDKDEARVSAIEKQYGVAPGTFKGMSPEDARVTGKPRNEPKKTQASQPIDPDQLKIIKVVRNTPDYKRASALGKYQLMTDSGVSKENAEAESKIASGEIEAQEKKTAQLRAETFPIKKQISDQAESSRKGIENKNNLLELVKTGNINDPTYVQLAESLPLNLGKRLLSNETVEYKAGLIDEFKDLRKIFSGATRIKEIELLENKIADTYLNDEQKEAILKSRINALKADLIVEEAAIELEQEGKDYGILEYSQKVHEKAKPKLDALFNNILDEHKAIIQNSENKKQIPLDPKDPDDFSVMKQILNEANGDKQKAKEIAKKKGYRW